MVHAAAMSFDLHVPESRSLKTKRAAIRPIVDGLRHRFRISVAEVAHQDQWQRAEIAVAIGLEGTLATVYTRAGERQLRVGEVADELARLRGEVERLRRLLDARQGAQG